MALESKDKNWIVLPSFDGQSRRSFSNASGQVPKPGQGIIRPVRGYIDMEGFFDLTFYDAEQLAGMLGWVRPTEADRLRKKIADLEAKLLTAHADALAEAVNKITALT